MNHIVWKTIFVAFILVPRYVVSCFPMSCYALLSVTGFINTTSSIIDRLIITVKRFRVTSSKIFITLLDRLDNR